MDPQKMFSGAATCEDVMQCFFNLNEFEIGLYLKLVDKGPQRSDELAKKVKRDATTVYRSLQKLISCGLCYRDTKTIDRGGYFHVYSAVDPELVRKKIKDCINKLNDTMKKALEEFDERYIQRR